MKADGPQHRTSSTRLYAVGRYGSDGCVLRLDGNRDHLTDEDLDRVVEYLPVAIMAGGRAR